MSARVHRGMCGWCDNVWLKVQENINGWCSMSAEGLGGVSGEASRKWLANVIVGQYQWL